MSMSVPLCDSVCVNVGVDVCLSDFLTPCLRATDEKMELTSLSCAGRDGTQSSHLRDKSGNQPAEQVYWKMTGFNAGAQK